MHISAWARIRKLRNCWARGKMVPSFLNAAGSFAQSVDLPRQMRYRSRGRFAGLRQAAEGYQHLHDCSIVHGDVGCHNMIITREGDLKIIDFEGCSIDSEPADSCYEWFSYRRRINTQGHSKHGYLCIWLCSLRGYNRKTTPPHMSSGHRTTDIGRLNSYTQAISFPMSNLYRWDG